MRFLFEKNNPSFFDILIRWWTRSPYSHVELLFSDGQKFSAVPGVGTRFAPASPIESQCWDILVLPTTVEQEAKIRAFCEREVGCKYDWRGIFFSQIIRMRRHCMGRWFCSEVCTAGMQAGGFMPSATPCTLSPGQFNTRLKEIGAVPCAS